MGNGMASRTGDVASHEEVTEEIRNLSDEDLLRLERFARYQVYRYPSINPKEILGEAVKRVLSGARTWPRSVAFKVFFCNVIRSVAGDVRRDTRTGIWIPGRDPDARAAPHTHPDDDPESQVADREFLRVIWKLFEDDHDVQALIQGLEEGLTAKEVQARFDMPESRYGAARKRLERNLARQYPNGMKL
jgi:DNA-directed RNA polymerase specialized sigma24 family protein